MRQMATALALCFAFTAAFALYVVSYDARRIEAHVVVLERKVERDEAAIAAARAELAHLSRPERIESLARAQGLKPPSPRQFVTVDRLPYRKAAP